MYMHNVMVSACDGINYVCRRAIVLSLEVNNAITMVMSASGSLVRKGSNLFFIEVQGRCTLNQNFSKAGVPPTTPHTGVVLNTSFARGSSVRTLKFLNRIFLTS